TPLLEGKETVSTGMMKEVDRCRRALAEAAEGRTVALVSGGDSGIYGMAGLALELAEEMEDPPEIEVVPGISAVQAASSVLGAPLMHDFAVISLSDLLTPWPTIRLRLEAAARADFVVALYNPRSKGRVTQIEEAQRIISCHRSAGTPVGIVRNACREGEEKTVTTLGDMLSHPIDMFSIVIIGNSATRLDRQGRMITPRGYATRGTGDRGPRTGAKAGTGDSGRGTGKGVQDHWSSPAVAHVAGGLPDFSRSPVPGPRSLMFCGTASDVGKSVITAGFCRILKRRGIAVAPFKSQNMALNCAVTPEGGEIGRAQGVQAEACGIAPHTDMNPVLLKPNSDTGSQVVVQGRVVGNMNVREYDAYKEHAFGKVRESFRRLRSRFDFIVLEGAGSIAEINLKHRDIANLKVAEMAGAPVVLIADIDRGGVFAQIVGTIELLEPREREMVKGVIINKFRGDASLLQPGIDYVERRTGIPVLGVVPWMKVGLPEEDSVALHRKGRTGDCRPGTGRIRIAVLKLPRISNYTDFDALEREPDVDLSYIDSVPAGGLDGFDLLILPGTKSTIPDLAFLKESGLFDALRSFGGRIAGICGGFQMLCRRVLDPQGVESSASEAEGLGLLEGETVLLAEKTTHRATARLTEAGIAAAPVCEGEL
ncbi:MAG TPA: cobyric acid synthase, partial [Verrucomicrobiae bacterium]|nr:cobyric acid synthase [Verrucomicrobiae bacterium]